MNGRALPPAARLTLPAIRCLIGTVLRAVTWRHRPFVFFLTPPRAVPTK